MLQVRIRHNGGQGWQVPEPVHVVDHVVLELLSLQSTTLPNQRLCFRYEANSFNIRQNIQHILQRKIRTVQNIQQTLEKYELCKIYYKYYNGETSQTKSKPPKTPYRSGAKQESP